MRAKNVGSASPASDVRRAAVAVGKRTLKRTAGPFLAVARASGLFGLARGATHADEALSYYQRRGDVRGSQLDLSEPPRDVKALAGSDRIPAVRPVTATLTLLDGGRNTLAFCNNHVIDSRGLVVVERANNEYGNPLPFRDLRVGRVRLETARRVSGSIGYLSNSGVSNFGHWFVLTFPLVRYYREYLGRDPDYYYVGTPLYEWHYDSLAALGIEADRILTDAVVGDRMLVALADNHVPSPTPFLDFSTDTLRKPHDPSAPSRRIYISRGERPLRRLTNEEACIEVLAQHGFESHRTEELSLREEIELFANAEAVAGLHGAGLTNLLFCHPRSVAVELFSFANPGFDAMWFSEMSAVRDITYASLYAEPARTTRNWGMRSKDHDALIDLDKLDALLAAASEAVRDRPLARNTKKSQSGA